MRLSSDVPFGMSAATSSTIFFWIDLRFLVLHDPGHLRGSLDVALPERVVGRRLLDGRWGAHLDRDGDLDLLLLLLVPHHHDRDQDQEQVKDRRDRPERRVPEPGQPVGLGLLLLTVDLVFQVLFEGLKCQGDAPCERGRDRAIRTEGKRSGAWLYPVGLEGSRAGSPRCFFSRSCSQSRAAGGLRVRFGSLFPVRGMVLENRPKSKRVPGRWRALGP